MKIVQMEKAMCVLTLIATKFVQKPTNWSYICWHTQEKDLTRYVVQATDSMVQSLWLSFNFPENLPNFTKCLESVCHYDLLPLLIFEAFLWGRLRLIMTLIFFCLFLLILNQICSEELGQSSPVSLWYCVTIFIYFYLTPHSQVIRICILSE